MKLKNISDLNIYIGLGYCPVLLAHSEIDIREGTEEEVEAFMNTYDKPFLEVILDDYSEPVELEIPRVNVKTSRNKPEAKEVLPVESSSEKKGSKRANTKQGVSPVA